MSNEFSISLPDHFSFPFEPCMFVNPLQDERMRVNVLEFMKPDQDEIQNSFMRNLFEAIEEGKVGIFESPTGTVSWE